MANGGRKHPAVDRPLVEENRVLLIVPRVRHDGDNHGCSGGQAVQLDNICRARIDQRLCGIIQDMRGLVHPARKIGRVNANRLLALGALVRVAGRLVVVRKGNARREYAKQRVGVNLAVSVVPHVFRGRQNVSWKGRDRGGVVLVRVNVLDDGPLDFEPNEEVVPLEVASPKSGDDAAGHQNVVVDDL